MSMRTDTRLLRRLRSAIVTHDFCVEHKKTLHFPKHLDKTGLHITVSLPDYHQAPLFQLRFSGRGKDAHRPVEMPTYIAFSTICERQHELDDAELLATVDKALAALSNKNVTPYVNGLKKELSHKKASANALARFLMFLDEVTIDDYVPKSVKLLYALNNAYAQWALSVAEDMQTRLQQALIELIEAHNEKEKTEALNNACQILFTGVECFVTDARLFMSTGLKQLQEYYRVERKLYTATNKHTPEHLILKIVGRQMNTPMALWPHK